MRRPAHHEIDEAAVGRYPPGIQDAVRQAAGRLEDIRRERKLTNAALAEALAVDRTTIGNWVRGRSPVPAYVFYQLGDGSPQLTIGDRLATLESSLASTIDALRTMKERMGTARTPEGAPLPTVILEAIEDLDLPDQDIGPGAGTNYPSAS